MEALAVGVIAFGLLVLFFLHNTNYLVYLAAYNCVMAIVFNLKSPIDALCIGISRNVIAPFLLLIMWGRLKLPDGSKLYDLIGIPVNGESVLYNRRLREQLGGITGNIDKNFEELMKMHAERVEQAQEANNDVIQVEDDEKNPYEVLGISEDASLKEIQAAYKKKALQNHPDRTAGLDEEYKQLAEKRMQEINSAYDALRKKF